MSAVHDAAEVLAKAQYGQGFEAVPARERQHLISAQLPAARALHEAGLLRDRTQEVLDRSAAFLVRAERTLQRSRRLDRTVIPRLSQAGVPTRR